jgi:Domain of unknown function (DUF4276)
LRRLACVVEGDGDQGALPVVLRSYLYSREIFDVEIGKPINSKGRSKLLREGELERFVRLAGLHQNTVGVLVLCDADDDAACKLGPVIHTRCQQASPNIPVRACLAVREFENWFLASPETLAPEGEAFIADYEAINAHAIVSSWFSPRKYVKPVQQPSLAARMDHQRVRERCPSFARLLRCVDELL